MRKHEQKRCPRCQALFECKSGSILLCQCQTVYLEPEHLEYVSELMGCRIVNKDNKGIVNYAY